MMRSLDKCTDTELWNEIVRRKVLSMRADPSISRMQPAEARDELVSQVREQRAVILGRFDEHCVSAELLTMMLRGLR